MSDFTLVNLAAQRDAVTQHVKGWSIPQILDWMRQYGTVTDPTENDRTRLHGFESQSGFRDAFYFTDDGELVVIVSGWVT